MDWCSKDEIYVIPHEVCLIHKSPNIIRILRPFQNLLKKAMLDKYLDGLVSPKRMVFVKPVSLFSTPLPTLVK